MVRCLDSWTSSEFDTSYGGTWRIAGCADYWSKYEFGWHISPMANQHDAIAAVEAAIVEADTLAGAPLLEQITDQSTGGIRPVVIVTDNGGPFNPTGSPASSMPVQN